MEAEPSIGSERSSTDRTTIHNGINIIIIII